MGAGEESLQMQKAQRNRQKANELKQNNLKFVPRVQKYRLLFFRNESTFF